MDDQKLDTWGVVEVMGHKKYAGRLREFVVGGTSFVRVDVPAVEGNHPEFCKLIGPGSVYCITPTDKATARKVVIALSGYAEILPVYVPVDQRRLPAPDEDGADDWSAVDDEAEAERGGLYK